MATVFRPTSSSRMRQKLRLIARDGALIRRPVVLPVIGANDVILPHFDRVLGEYAVRAQLGDLDARNALYTALRPKLDRLAVGVRTPFCTPTTVGVWDEDDVQQEGFLVFIELVDAWAGDVSFTAFVLSRFVWRMRDVFRRGLGRLAETTEGIVPLDDERTAPSVETPEDLGQADAILAVLPPHLQHALMLAAFGGMNKSEIARAMGISRRTVVRYWNDMRQIVSASMGEGWPLGLDRSSRQRRPAHEPGPIRRRPSTTTNRELG